MCATRSVGGHRHCPSVAPVSTAVQLRATLAPAHQPRNGSAVSSDAHPSAPLQRCSIINTDLCCDRQTACTDSAATAAKSTPRAQHTAVDKANPSASELLASASVVWAVVASCVAGSAQLPLCPSGWTYDYDSSGVEGHDSCVWLSSTTAVWAQANSTCR